MLTKLVKFIGYSWIFNAKRTIIFHSELHAARVSVLLMILSVRNSIFNILPIWGKTVSINLHQILEIEINFKYPINDPSRGTFLHFTYWNWVSNISSWWRKEGLECDF